MNILHLHYNIFSEFMPHCDIFINSSFIYTVKWTFLLKYLDIAVFWILLNSECITKIF